MFLASLDQRERRVLQVPKVPLVCKVKEEKAASRGLRVTKEPPE